MTSSDSLMMAYLGLDEKTCSPLTQKVLKDLAYRYPNGSFEISNDLDDDIKFNFSVLDVHFELTLEDWQYRVRYQFRSITGAFTPELKDIPYSTSGDIIESVYDIKRYNSDFANMELFVSYCLYAG
jgi:hypothetical protein